MIKSKACSQKLEERKRRKRESEQKRRDKVKSDETLWKLEKAKERERYHRRCSEGKIKQIANLSKRCQRQKRKMWRNSSRKYRKGKITNVKNQENNNATAQTAQPLDEVVNNAMLNSSLVSLKHLAGRKKVRKDRASAYRKIKILEIKLLNSERKAERYKKRLQRQQRQKVSLQKSPDSPSSRVDQFLSGRNVSSDIKKKLILGEVLQLQLASSYRQAKGYAAKQRFCRLIGGEIIKKYRMILHSKCFLSYRQLKNKGKVVEMCNKKIAGAIASDVCKFLENDNSSKVVAGKKECITRKKVKKQKRILCDTLQNLYSGFLKSHPYKISYSFFCKMRPFWILFPKVSERETCLCCVCENMRLMYIKLYYHKIVTQKSVKDVCRSMCCTSATEGCMERNCEECKNKSIVAENRIDDETVVEYEQWVRKKVPQIVKSREVDVTKIMKEKITCNINELLHKLEEMAPNFLIHLNNINHQYNAIIQLKETLDDESVLLHIDFSENYQCKFNAEI